MFSETIKSDLVNQLNLNPVNNDDNNTEGSERKRQESELSPQFRKENTRRLSLLYETPHNRSLKELFPDSFSIDSSLEDNGDLNDTSIQQGGELISLEDAALSPQNNSRPERVRKPPKYLEDYIHE